MNKPGADIRIQHAHILTMDSNLTEYGDGCIDITGQHITYLGSFGERPTRRVKEVIDGSGMILMPPFFNAHSHAPMSVMRGLGNDVPLQVWLEKYIWPVEQKCVNADLVYLGTLLSGMEMIQSGTNIFADMYFFEAEVARASVDLGMRCILGEGLLDYPTPNSKNPEETLLYTEQLIKNYADHDLVNLAIPAHAPYTCSREVLQMAASFAKKHELQVTIHLAETEREVAEHIEKYSQSPTQYLADIGFLDQQAICYHCNYLSDNDLKIFQQSNTTAVTLPNSNGKLASGIAPIKEMLEHDILVALGTDGAASNNNMSMINDLQLMLRYQKVKHLDPKALSAQQAIQIATANGAKAYRMYEHLGSLEIGKSADCILIDTESPHMQPLYDPYAQIAYSMLNKDIDSMLIAGQFVMKNRQIIRINPEEILREIRKISKKLNLN